MSAVANDTRPFGINAFAALRAMPEMTVDELGAILATAAGHLSEKMGAHHTAQVMANVLAAAHKVSAPMSMAEVAFYVATKHGITVKDLLAPASHLGSRAEVFSHPRQEAYWLAYQQRTRLGERAYSMPQIGKYFGGRDHSTVMRGVRKHTARLVQEQAQ